MPRSAHTVEKNPRIQILTRNRENEERDSFEPRLNEAMCARLVLALNRIRTCARFSGTGRIGKGKD